MAELNQRVRVRIVSTMIDPDGDRNEIKGAYSGTLRVENGETIVEYEEVQDGERARIELRVGENRAQMVRKGMTNAKLTFVPGTRTSSAYVTMYGEIPVAVDTRVVAVEPTAVGGKITLDYDVYVSGERTSSTLFCMTWRA